MKRRKKMLEKIADLNEREWKIVHMMTSVDKDTAEALIERNRNLERYLTLQPEGEWKTEDGKKEVVGMDVVIGMAKAIAADGYDTSGFELECIPEPHVLCFVNKAENKRFDYCWGPNGAYVPAYVVLRKEAAGDYSLIGQDADTIAEAVEKYADLNLLDKPVG